MGPDAMILVLWMLSFKPALSLSSFTLIKRLFSSSSLSAIRVVSSAYLRLLIFLQAILTSACDSSIPAFHMIYFAWKLNKHYIQLWWTSFLILNQSISDANYCFLCCIQVSQEADKVVWYSHLLKNFPQFVVIHTVRGFNVVNGGEVDVFLEFSCFFYDSTDVGNLISGSSAFSKSILYIWNFLVHVLLKPSLKDFEHYLASMWNEHNCAVVLTLPFFGIGMKTDLVQSCAHCWVFQICWHIESST